MKVKSKFGMGAKNKRRRRGGKKRISRKKQITLRNLIKSASKSMVQGKCAQKVISSALRGVRAAVKKAGGKENVILPRVLPIPPKVEGFLPFSVPMFAGLSAIGALAGGTAGIVRAVNDTKSARGQLEESERHNKIMETILLGKGRFVKPYKEGLGLHLKAGKGLKKKSST